MLHDLCSKLGKKTLKKNSKTHRKVLHLNFRNISKPPKNRKSGNVHTNFEFDIWQRQYICKKGTEVLIVNQFWMLNRRRHWTYHPKRNAWNDLNEQTYFEAKWFITSLLFRRSLVKITRLKTYSDFICHHLSERN